MKQVFWDGALTTSGSNARGPSYSIWHDCPINDILSGAVDGFHFYDDFGSFPITPATTEGNWSFYSQFSSTGGTITAGTGQGGEAIFASDGDNEGASIRTLATPFKIATTTKRLWFEARVKTSTIADSNCGWFVGLMENTALTAIVPITAAGAIADKNIVGLHRLEGDGDQVDFVYKADGVTQVTVLADALGTGTSPGPLVADTYMKLGFKFEPEPDLYAASITRYVLTGYANGIRFTTTKTIPTGAGTDFPNDVALGGVLAILNATGTSPGTLTIDEWRMAQSI